MATATLAWTRKGALAQISGSDPFVWGTSDMRLILLEADFDGAVVEFINHASFNEAESGDGSYPTGGYSLSNETATDAAGPIIALKADSITDTGVTLDDPVTYCALVKWTGTAGTTRVYAKGTITGTVQPSAGGLTINFQGHSGGVSGTVLQVGS